MKLSLGQLKSLLKNVLEGKKPDAGPFKVGDTVLKGKYKNQKATIKKIFNDKKGHVTVELEPNPKGRKKNKEVGLYKIWPDDDQ